MSKIYTDIMIDIETLGTTPNAQVLSIAAVAFNPFEITTDFSENPTLDLLLTLEDQQNRHVDDGTLVWWSKQSHEVQDRIFGESDRVSIVESLEQLSKFCWLKNRIWAQGITMDICILTDLYGEHKKSVPWNYGAVRDSRTLLDLYSVNQPLVTHDSLADVLRQISGTQQAIKGLGITKFVREH
jgi:hypothetical protein